jgi:ferric-chelate reductase (NADPH)
MISVQLRMIEATLIECIADDAHLAAAEAEVLRLAASGGHFVLTGNASTSAQRVSRALKAFGVVSSRVKTKAYWAQGKIGLD